MSCRPLTRKHAIVRSIGYGLPMTGFSMPRGSLTITLAALAACAVLASEPTRAAAQEQPLQAAGGAVHWLGALEVSLVLGGWATIGSGALEHDSRALVLCTLLLPMCALAPLFGLEGPSDLLAALLVLTLDVLMIGVVPPIVAASADAGGLAVDFPLVLTTSVAGGISTALFATGIGIGAGGEDVGILFAIVGGVLGAAGGFAYSALRVNELARDPRVGLEANFLVWAPAVLGPIASFLMLAVDAGPVVGPIVAGLVGLLAMGASILAAEIALANEPPPPVMMAPLADF